MRRRTLIALIVAVGATWHAGAESAAQTFRDKLANAEPCPMCPELVVVPAGRFTLGSPPDE